MTFAHPAFLLLLLALPLAVWIRRKFQREPAFLYSSVGLLRAIKPIQNVSPAKILAWLRWSSLALLIVALAQPRLIQGESKIRSRGIDIVVALDLSYSMAAIDFKLDEKTVNRLDAAKVVLTKFVKSRPNDRVGLIVFAGQAYVASPPTLDHEFLLRNISRLDLKTLKDPGTAIGMALTTSLNRLRDRTAKSRIVILMTDGQNNTGTVPPLAAAEAAARMGIKVYTIGVGTRGTALEPYTDAFGRERFREVKVDIDEKTLTAIADKTSGRYYRADNTETLDKIYAEIDRMEKTTAEVQKFREYRELFHVPLLIGMALFGSGILLGNTLWRKLP